MNIGQYLARTKEQADRKALRKVIAEYNEIRRETELLRRELQNQTPPNRQ